MKGVIYNGNKRTLTLGDDRELDFYCGAEFCDVGLILASLVNGQTNIQEAYIDLIKLSTTTQQLKARVEELEEELTTAIDIIEECGVDYEEILESRQEV